MSALNEVTILENSLQTWIIAAAVLIGSIAVSRLLYLLSAKVIRPFLVRRKNVVLHIIFDMLEEPVSVLIIVAGASYSVSSFRIEPGVLDVLHKILLALLCLIATWTVARLVDDLIKEYVEPNARAKDTRQSLHVLSAFRKILRVVIWITGLVIAVDNAGYNVGAVLAGLGIGGLAFALAAQDTIANLFGGIVIFTDSPFKLNDRIRVNGLDGFVREIGLRTSKLETLDGRKLSVPNSIFSKSPIENVSSEPTVKVAATIGLSQECGPAKVQRAIALITQILGADEALGAEKFVSFNEIGNLGLNLGVVYFVKKEFDPGDIKTRINLAILKAFEAEDIVLAKVAFPTAGF